MPCLSSVFLVPYCLGVHQFTSRDFTLQLRRRGIQPVVLSGISTNISVEPTARNACGLDFELVLVEDICRARDRVQHNSSF
ncbi:isochorismatase family protein [Sodalis sp.]|uniref:isochorismatase family protein n=1 Tax=Sodalis sp. (in: enterobacteria) TaxID=1898979 RepID=UPI003872B926